MNVIFFVVLGFMGHTLMFFLQKNKTILSINLLVISSFLAFFSLLVYGASLFEFTPDLSLGILFSCLSGPFLLLLTVEKRRSWRYYVAVAGLLFVLLLAYGYSSYFYPENVNQFKAALLALSIFITLGFGSYGYLNYINDKGHTKNQAAAILFYVVLLFVSLFFFSSALLKGGEALNCSDFIFSLFSLGVCIYACGNEVVNFVQQNKQSQPTASKKLKWKYFQGTNVTITRNAEQAQRGAKKETVKGGARPEETFLDPTLVKQALFTKVIETGLFLDNNLTLFKVAELTQIDKNKLHDYFKKSESSSFKQYINRLKVEYAINVIREKEKDITVEELTVVCGFNTRLSFYRAFVYFYGFPPSELLND